ncbi:Peptidase E [Streptoalloteichus tenebrarius]|uniref:Peptidase E n=2 Tax=Streptoalloteichus tenebrarius (strain ATCC 17920 / DSM 40477 / JCM 4838 / CBS 697.72 / NBRC 16177 / NCIMB 11028 / NRRL B-12390 / A12253. 1 / ISP 5477) TaxID=1933 RepID=A0ABT1HWE1_STRSD|nr:Peptidase E [Streptoalloteichus tenebrarius]BFE99203.1 peptidase E [Streptoalloteichus tenebrarius]
MGFNRARNPWRPGPVFRYAFDLAGSPARPRLCFVSTGTGDRQASIDAFYAAFADTGVRTSHLALFEDPNVPDVAAHLREQDVIWVDRGSVINLLAVWRAHGLPEILAECWRAGVVLAGESAGSLCWHTGVITDSYGGLRGTADGLGLVPYANAVHYGEGARRAAFHQFLAESPDHLVGYATDTGAGLQYEHDRLAAVIADRPCAGAYRVVRGADGEIVEEPLDVTRLKRDKGS